MEIQVAIEPQGFRFFAPVFAVLAGDIESLSSLGVGFGVEGDALKWSRAVVACEAFRVEAVGGGGDDAAGDGEGARCASCGWNAAAGAGNVP